MLSVKSSRKKNSALLAVIAVIFAIIAFLLLKNAFGFSFGAADSESAEAEGSDLSQWLFDKSAGRLDAGILDESVFSSLVDNSIAPRSKDELQIGNSSPFEGKTGE